MTSSVSEPVGPADHLDAWKTTLAVLARVPAYDQDDEKSLPSLAVDHLLVDVAERVGGAYRMANTAATVRRGWLLSVLIVSPSAVNCLRLRGRLSTLRFTRLVIANRATSPLDLEASDDFPDPVEQHFELRSDWIYTHP